MNKKIVVNAEPNQTRIALLENDIPVELYIEGPTHQRHLGNIIKGIVTKVLPGMQAAFVDIGLKKDAFLYVMDVFDNTEEFAKLLGRGEDEEGVDDYTGAAIEPILSASIDELLREGQEVLVQVSREPMGYKGARVTSHITLPGRYLVFMPTVNHVGVSKRIQEDEERRCLKARINELRQPNLGYIVRTVGRNRAPEDFKSDMESLNNLWQRILDRADKARPPSVIHRDLDPLFRTVRDLLDNDVERLIIDSETEYQRCVEFVDTILPHLTSRVKLHVKNTSIFEEYGIGDEVEKALQRKVWLKSGGYIVIDQTEALVAIDVNTGRYVGKRNLEETITRINIEAAKLVGRQIRLRDLGGIIIIDFIDMTDEEDQRKVLQALDEVLRHDRARTCVYGFTELGLVEMTRKRVRGSLKRSLGQPCPYCAGEGMIKSPVAVAYEVYRELQKVGATIESPQVTLRVNPEIARLLRSDQRELVEQLEEAYGWKVMIKSEDSLHHEQFDIVTM
ncbi:Rne/Rng family ribonuclease [bacterium]|nr:Rne/Rng family ribonuclease [candidate division CSSED10-310 bacterium]